MSCGKERRLGQDTRSDTLRHVGVTNLKEEELVFEDVCLASALYYDKLT